jgi:hypothetical protein
MDNADDIGKDDSDDNHEFTNDEDGFVMMTPVVMMSQTITAKSTATKASFTCSMILATYCAMYQKIASFTPRSTAKAAAWTSHKGTCTNEKD